MPDVRDIEVLPTVVPFRLSDRIQDATSIEAILNDDGSTTVYVRLYSKERFSTLPRSKRPKRRRLFASRRRVESPGDRLTDLANVRRVKRGSIDGA